MLSNAFAVYQEINLNNMISQREEKTINVNDIINGQEEQYQHTKNI